MSVDNGDLARLGLTLDPDNANKGTKRGLEQLEQSIEQFGAGRSAVADADGVVRAGNKSLATALEKGLPVRVVETDGATFTVLKRTDLRGLAAVEYGLADNRVSEVDLAWDLDELEKAVEAGVDLTKLWFPDELERLFSAAPADGEPAATTPPPAPLPDTRPRVNSVTLYLASVTFEEFTALVAACAKRFSTANPSETILAALRASLPPE